MLKRKLAKIGLGVGLLALCWLLNATGLIKEGGTAVRNAGERPAATQTTTQATQVEAPAQPSAAATTTTAADKPVKPSVATVKDNKPTKPAPDDGVVKDGEYYDKERVAAYLRKFDGKLPKNYITKSKARSLGWQGGPLEPYAPGKAIGGDWFGNYEHRLPNGTYKECDIGTRGRARGTKRLIYTPHGKKIYYTGDHYETFEEVVAR